MNQSTHFSYVNDANRISITNTIFLKSLRGNKQTILIKKGNAVVDQKGLLD